MRRLLVTTFVTLDGVMQAPGGPGEDDSGGFRFGGWSANYWDDPMGQLMGEVMAKPFDLLLGRKTYDIFSAYWPNATDNPGAQPLNDATKYVASRSGRPLEWGPSVLIRDAAAELPAVRPDAKKPDSGSVGADRGRASGLFSCRPSAAGRERILRGGDGERITGRHRP